MERTKKEIDMDYEKKYKEALKDMRVIYPNLKGDAKLAVEHAFPELAESEDERIRKKLIWQVQMNVEDETADLQKSVYNGVKGHDPDLEESIEDWKKCLAWLEKQKEQKPLSTEETELNSIAFLEQMGYTCIPPGAKTAECIEDSVKFEEGFKAGRESGLRDGQKYVLNNLDSYGLCKPAEWSEEDEKIRRNLMSLLVNMRGDRITEETYQKYYPWLKDLHPSWKPSGEQMGALNYAYCELFKREGVGHNILGPLQKLLDDLKKLM